MPLDARIFKAFVYRIAVILLIGALSGCGPQSAQLPTYMRPELLYLKHQQYSRLYIEVDTIEEIDVPDQWLDELKIFLGKYCSKPDGIEIVRDEPVPIPENEGLPIGLASILCIDGPHPDSGPQPAYMHIFFYDTNIAFKRGRKNPYVATTCSCAIFFNVDYTRQYMYALKHEAGHVLGLCRNTAHGDGTHCRNYGCMMHWTPELLSQLGLFPLKDQLCAHCQTDLEAWKSEDVDSKLVFKGPFLIRREDGYSIASLPYCDLLIPTSIEDMLEWQEVLLHIKKVIEETFPKDSEKYRESKKKAPRIWGLYLPTNKGASQMSAAKTLSVLTKATNDPNPIVRRNAAEELEKLKQEQ